jgi:hypothetical protein
MKYQNNPPAFGPVILFDDPALLLCFAFLAIHKDFGLRQLRSDL